MRSAGSALLLLLASTAAPGADAPDVLPGTARLSLTQPLDVVMVDGINRFALRELHASPLAENRESLFGRSDKTAAHARDRLREIIGAVDPRVPPNGFEFLHTTAAASKLAEAPGYSVHAVRWRTLPGVTAEGILLQPKARPMARVVALPDADWTAEAFAGLAPG